ncbi:SDR family oxidoreductase [Neisseriaceae bacterium CLB008]|nr:SDR family oxidoreductase [Neisseriaceae bacterium]
MPQPSPDQKVILITGGAKRIGQALVQHFHDQGWWVCIHCHQSTAAATSLSDSLPNSSVHALDLTQDYDAFSAYIEAIYQQHGRLDALINNAARFEPDHFYDFQPDSFNAQMQVNFRAPVYFSAAYGAALKAREHEGSVVQLLDQKLFNLNPDYYSYTLSKLALKQSVRMSAMAAAPYLRINAIAPGLSLISGDQSPENFAQAHVKTALGRGTECADLAAAADYLVNARAVTGQTLTVDHGQHLVPLARDVMFTIDK